MSVRCARSYSFLKFCAVCLMTLSADMDEDTHLFRFVKKDMKRRIHLNEIICYFLIFVDFIFVFSPPAYSMCPMVSFFMRLANLFISFVCHSDLLMPDQSIKLVFN